MSLYAPYVTHFTPRNRANIPYAGSEPEVEVAKPNTFPEATAPHEDTILCAADHCNVVEWQLQSLICGQGCARGQAKVVPTETSWTDPSPGSGTGGPL